MPLSFDKKQRLLRALEVPRTIPDVVRIMNMLLEELEPGYGTAVFVRLYRDVTVSIEARCKAHAWLAPDWLERLDVIFAELFFEAFRLWLRDARNVPTSWRALFDRAERPSIMPAQFVLGGMCAHILFDLGKAVALASIECRTAPLLGSTLYRDFREINRILLNVEIQALQYLVDGWLAVMRDRFDPDGTRVMVVVKAAREQAYGEGMTYYALKALDRDAEAELFLRHLDLRAARISKAILLPTRVP